MSNKGRVLIVEDDSAIRNALVSRCRSEGFEVHEATNGEEGAAMAAELNPDIVLMDIVMPKMDGIEALEIIRSTKDGVKLPVIMLTNMMPDEHILREVTKSSPTYYLVKSDTALDEVVSKIKTCLKG